MNFSKVLLQWYLQNKRDLPWRNTTNPYPIWLSEIILQQTRVAQGMPYFLKFTTAFPTIFELANADEETVLKLWQGLGYYSRARNLHKTAQIVAFEFNGVFPNSYPDLLKLKGIGTYTAAAIASFSYNEAVPVVDGNVFRVLSRYFDIETDISTSEAKSEFTTLAYELLPKDKAYLFNQAIMEFGALHCVPKNPDCTNCIFKDSCLALQKKKVSSLPVKSKKLKVTKRYFNYLVYSDDENKTIIQKRTDKGIWHNLYEFPLIETALPESDDQIILLINNRIEVSNAIINITSITPEPIIHKLSHQHLNIKFWKIDVKGTISDGIECNQAKKFPFPIVIYNFIEQDWF